MVTTIVDSASRNELPPKVSGLVLRSRLMTSVICSSILSDWIEALCCAFSSKHMIVSAFLFGRCCHPLCWLVNLILCLRTLKPFKN